MLAGRRDQGCKAREDDPAVELRHRSGGTGEPEIAHDQVSTAVVLPRPTPSEPPPERDLSRDVAGACGERCQIRRLQAAWSEGELARVDVQAPHTLGRGSHGQPDQWTLGGVP